MQNFPFQHCFTKENPENPAPDTTARQETPAPEQRGKRVLIMDDEPSILELTGRMLGSHGYDVETARDGNTAVKQYRAAMEAGRRFDAVILDLTVPEGMGGFDAFKAIHEFDPGVQAILSSGYSHEPAVLNYKNYGIAGVAPKPYRVKDLVEAVEGVLAGK